MKKPLKHCINLEEKSLYWITIFQRHKNSRYFKKNGINFVNFDCSNLSSLEKNFKTIITQYGCPDIFINCSYPRSNDWPQNSFTEIKLKSLRKNIEVKFDLSIMVSKNCRGKMAEKFKNKNSDKSIIFIGLIYGLLDKIFLCIKIQKCVKT